MKSRTWTVGWLCLSLAMVLSAGCSKKDNPAAPQVPTPTDVGQVIQQAGKLQPLSADKDTVTDTQTSDQGGFRTITEKHDAAKNIQEITYLGLNDDVIWPGNLIKGTKVHQFEYEPVVGVARNPVTLSINLENSGSGSVITQAISDPKLSTVRQGINDLLGKALQAGTTYAARAQFDKTQVYSESQLNLVVGADLKYGAGSLNTKFDWASTTNKTKIIAKYQQLYYTIDMDTPDTPAAVFASSNTLDGIRAAIPAGSCPVYVAGITYGMMALTFIETSYSGSDMNVALEAAYNNPLGLDVEIRTGLTKRQVLANSNIKTVVYGGSSAGLGQIENGYQGFMDVVKASIHLGTASPGVPLIYRFRHLCDNNLANVTLTSQYSLTRVIRLRQAIRIIADKFVCTETGDDCAWDDTRPDITRFLVRANATQRTSATDPGVNYCLADTTLYDGGGQEMSMNEERPMGTSVVFELDAENFNYEFATIKLYAHVDEHDAFTCPNDSDEEYITITASEFSSNPHTIILTPGEGATLRCEVTIEMANAPQRQFAARRR